MEKFEQQALSEAQGHIKSILESLDKLSIVTRNLASQGIWDATLAADLQQQAQRALRIAGALAGSTEDF